MACEENELFSSSFTFPEHIKNDEKQFFFVEGHQREVEKVSNFHVFFHLTPSEALFKEIYCKHLCVLTCPFLLWQLKK